MDCGFYHSRDCIDYLILDWLVHGLARSKGAMMATEPCSPISKPGGPQGKVTPLPKPPKPESPGASGGEFVSSKSSGISNMAVKVTLNCFITGDS